MKKLTSRIIHSTMARLTIVVGGLAFTTGAAIIVSWMVFHSIQEQMVNLSSERVPVLRSSADVIEATNDLRILLEELLSAASKDEVDKLAVTKDAVMEEFYEKSKSLPAQEAKTIHSLLDSADDSLNNLIGARNAEFAANDEIQATLETAFENANVISLALAQANQQAFENMTNKSEEAISTIDRSLTKLVDEDFAQFQTALTIRAEVNMLAGLALTLTQLNSGSTRPIILDLATSASERLTVLLSETEDAGAMKDVLAAVSEAQTVYQDAIFRKDPTIDALKILAARVSVDQILLPTLDDIFFNLVIGSDDAKSTNAETLENLVNVEVASMRQKGNIDAATKDFFVALLKTALATDITQTADLQEVLENKAVELSRLSESEPEIIRSRLTQILDLATSKNGISALQANSIQARSFGMKASKDAAQAVTAISKAAVDFSAIAVSGIDGTAEDLSRKIDRAVGQINQISFIGAILVLIAPILVWAMVTRPLAKVTNVTERLASGDLGEISELSVNEGEMGRMAKALNVFRHSALETIRLTEEEKRREKHQIEQEREEARKREAEKERIRQMEIEQAEEKRAFEAKQNAKAEAIRKAAEDERISREAEQKFVVSQLAEGLQRLANGDLTTPISAEFPSSYEALRKDYNRALQHQFDVARHLEVSSQNMRNSVEEIAASSNDLSKRTENNAATLEETVAAIGELASNVEKTAEGANSASATASSVMLDAEQSQKVMTNAALAMQDIEDSSGKISSIVEVIDAIAFQTNLLALNAGVEAARAGSAGQGFAVVASEVRTLAQRCSDAALEINGLVSEASQSVKNGVSLTAEANSSINTILDGIKNVAQNIEAIAIAATEQSHGIKEIDAAIQQLDKSTQQNAAMFEETTAANQALTIEARNLREIVSTFQTTSDPNARDTCAA